MPIVQVSPTHFVAVPAEANGVHAIDGYTFTGMSYQAAADYWYYELYRKPGYVSKPPVTQVSAPLVVAGTVTTVSETADSKRSSWGVSA